MREEEGCDVRDAALYGLDASSEDSGSSSFERWNEELKQAQVQVRHQVRHDGVDHATHSTKRTCLSGPWQTGNRRVPDVCHEDYDGEMEMEAESSHYTGVQRLKTTLDNSGPTLDNPPFPRVLWLCDIGLWETCGWVI